MSIPNFRVNFGGEDIDYVSNFQDCRKYFPILKILYSITDYYKVPAWHFFEPYVEFTWVAYGSPTYQKKILNKILECLEVNGIKPSLVHKPEDGVIVDWYCKNPQEQRFGWLSYAMSAKMAMLFIEHEEDIKKGCGEENQFMRRMHVLANQLGMNYSRESDLLNKRALLAKLFWEYGDHAKAVAEYEEVTGEKYL